MGDKGLCGSEAEFTYKTHEDRLDRDIWEFCQRGFRSFVWIILLFFVRCDFGDRNHPEVVNNGTLGSSVLDHLSIGSSHRVVPSPSSCHAHRLVDLWVLSQ